MCKHDFINTIKALNIHIASKNWLIFVYVQTHVKNPYYIIYPPNSFIHSFDVPWVSEASASSSVQRLQVCTTMFVLYIAGNLTQGFMHAGQVL